MNNFLISSLITKSAYTNYLLREVYQKPYYIIITSIGLGLLIVMVLQTLGILNFSLGIEMLFYALVLITIPLINVIVGRKIYLSSENLNHEIKYTFGEDGISVNAYAFEAFLEWGDIIKYKETAGLLLLYTNEKLANFVKLDAVSNDQLAYIKSKIRQ